MALPLFPFGLSFWRMGRVRSLLHQGPGLFVTAIPFQAAIDIVIAVGLGWILLWACGYSEKIEVLCLILFRMTLLPALSLPYLHTTRLRASATARFALPPWAEWTRLSMPARLPEHVEPLNGLLRGLTRT